LGSSTTTIGWKNRFVVIFRLSLPSEFAFDERIKTNNRGVLSIYNLAAIFAISLGKEGEFGK
jgi:hypothetical protein